MCFKLCQKHDGLRELGVLDKKKYIEVLESKITWHNTSSNSLNDLSMVYGDCKHIWVQLVAYIIVYSGLYSAAYLYLVSIAALRTFVRSNAVVDGPRTPDKRPKSPLVYLLATNQRVICSSPFTAPP